MPVSTSRSRSSLKSIGPAVLGREDEEADRLAGELLEHLAERGRAFRLADLADFLGGQVALGGPGAASADFADLAAGLHQPVVQPVLGHRLCRGSIRSGRFRFRGAGRSGRARRRGCRTSRPAACGSWRSIRCASRAGRVPRGWARTARRAWPTSRGRNRRCRVSARPCRRLRPAWPRRRDGSACRSRGTWPPRSTRRPAPRRRTPSR